MRSQAVLSSLVLLIVSLHVSAEPGSEETTAPAPKKQEGLVEIYLDAGSKALIQGYAEDAGRLLRTALEVAERNKLETMAVSHVLENLGKLLEGEGKKTEAQSCLERSTAIVEKVMGPESIPALKGREELADFYRRSHKYQDMERVVRGALEVTLKDPNHQLNITFLQQLAECCRLQRKYKEAEEFYLKLLDRVKERDGGESQLTALALNNLAAMYREKGDNAAAERYLESALALMQKVFAPEHPSALVFLCSLADVKRVQGKLDESLRLYSRGLEITGAPGVNPALKSLVLLNVAKFYQDQHDEIRASQFYKEGLDTLEKASGENRTLALELLKVGELYLERGKAAQAQGYLERSRTLSEQLLGTENEDTARVYRALGKCYIALGRSADAESLLKHACTVSEKAAGATDLTVGYSLELLGDLYAAQGKTAEAESCFEKSIAIEEKFSDQAPQRLAENLESYARLLQKMDRKEDAGKHAQRARDVRAQANLPPAQQ
jgi:tetratricopeptide (TPR) repeat protein